MTLRKNCPSPPTVRRPPHSPPPTKCAHHMVSTAHKVTLIAIVVLVVLRGGQAGITEGHHSTWAATCDKNGCYKKNGQYKDPDCCAQAHSASCARSVPGPASETRLVWLCFSLITSRALTEQLRLSVNRFYV